MREKRLEGIMAEIEIDEGDKEELVEEPLEMIVEKKDPRDVGISDVLRSERW